jgi:hypothetical protein
MKKRELLRMLAAFPDDVEIYVDGYESDLDKPFMRVALAKENQDRVDPYSGHYFEADELGDGMQHGFHRCIIISRYP